MPTFTLLQTIAAAAADIVSSGGTVSITNSPAFGYEGISSLVRTASVAETLQITTLTPTAAASSTYSGVIRQYDIATNKFLTATFSYVTAATGETATTISNGIRAQLNAFITAGTFKAVLTGTTTVIITALTRFPIFTVTLISLGGGLTQATGTPGVQSVNLAADVLLAYSKAGLSAPTLTGASYTSYAYRYATAGPLDLGNVQRNIQDLNTLFVDNTVGANYTNFNARMVEVQLGYTAGSTTVPDPLLVSRPVTAQGAAEN